MKLFDFIIANVLKRPPDFIVGGLADPYLNRWFLIPRNPILNIYIHQFLRSDDDRALHDHPWANCSVLMRGQYTEHRIKQGGINVRTVRRAGDWCIRASGKIAHRVDLTHGPCWTLFVTGPRYRAWGFHCPEQGWIHWAKFVAKDDSGAIGKGCNQ